jgi:cytochrome c oxidase subunit 2
MSRATGDPMNYFHPHGTLATIESHLGWWLMIVSGVVVLVVLGLVVLGSIRGGRRAARDSSIMAGNPRANMRWIYVGGIIVPATILVLTMAFTLGNLNATTHPRRTPAFTVHIVGHRWWWEARYEGPGMDSVVTANEIHIPIGQPVKLLLTSADVVHSFWIPQLAGKTDVNPGAVNVAWIEADTTGIYRGQCTEYCGLQHANMAAFVIADDSATFANWLAGQRAPAQQPGDPDAMRGRQVFVQGSCASCHTIRGTDARGVVGPDLTHLDSRLTLAAGAVPNTRGNLGGWIANSQGIKPGNQMPSMYLPPRDLQALIAYLETLR